jgi:hypothetical protein
MPQVVVANSSFGAQKKKPLTAKFRLAATESGQHASSEPPKAWHSIIATHAALKFYANREQLSKRFKYFGTICNGF